MAKKSKKRPAPKIIVNADGSKSDGMFKWGGSKRRQSPSEMLGVFNAMAAAMNQLASERLTEIRDCLTENVLPHIVGPIDPAAQREWQANGQPDSALQLVHLPSGSGCYIVSPDAPPALSNAIDALAAVQEIEHVLSTSKDADKLVKSAIRLGRLCERFELRMLFADFVLTEKQRRSPEGGKASAKLTNAEWKLVVDERKARCKREKRSALLVSVAIALELEQGTFPDIKQKVSNAPSAETIRKKK